MLPGMLIREIEHGGQEYRGTLAMRHGILRAPLGLDWSADDLTGEDGQLHFGLFDDEDTVQEAFLRAVSNWQEKGLPEVPLAWLKTVAAVSRSTLVLTMLLRSVRNCMTAVTMSGLDL